MKMEVNRMYRKMDVKNFMMCNGLHIDFLMR